MLTAWMVGRFSDLGGFHQINSAEIVKNGQRYAPFSLRLLGLLGGRIRPNSHFFVILGPLHGAGICLSNELD